MPVEFHVAEFVDAEQVDAAVAGDRLVEFFVVGGLDEFVDEFPVDRSSRCGSAPDAPSPATVHREVAASELVADPSGSPPWMPTTQLAGGQQRIRLPPAPPP